MNIEIVHLIFRLLFSDAGNSVFLYEFQHRPSMFETIRPDFVKADHGDEIGFVFGAPFRNGDIKITGKKYTSFPSPI